MMIEIRPIKKNDLLQVHRLLLQLSGSVESSSLSAQTQLEDLFTYITAHPEMYQTLVAEEEGTVVGLIALVFYRVWYHPGGTALITELVIDEAYRGKGIGSMLIDEGIKAAQAHGMDEIEVGTECQNAGAQRFYRRCGFGEEYVLLGMEFE
jgi:ribosomal protein S18 acetylase RimI-like enzyme